MPDIFSASWSETDGSNNSASPNGWATGAPPSVIKYIGQMMMGALKRWFNLASPVYTTAGSATVLTITPGVAVSAYATGLTIDCILGSDVDAAATLNVSSLGAKKVYVQTQAGLRVTAANEARAANRVRFSYDATLDSAAGGWVMRDQPLAGATLGYVLTANGADAEPTFQAASAPITGTFIPALKFGGGNSSMTGTFTGSYTKIGNLVAFFIEITLTAKGPATGTATLDGLPFAASAIATGGILALIGGTFSGLAATPFYTLKSASALSLSQLSGVLTHATFSDTSHFCVTGVYQAA